MKIRFAKDENIDSIKEIWRYCFNDTEAFEQYYFNKKYKSENTVVVEDNEEIVSSLQLNQYKINLNSKVYDTSYVVGVSTFPQVRGRGYMKNLMSFTLKELYNKGQVVSILMPIDYRLYRKYGYEHCYDQLEYNIDIEDLSRFKLDGRLYKSERIHSDHLIQIANEHLKSVNGSTIRDKAYYEDLFEEVKSENGHIYIHEDNGYEGYIIYFLSDNKMFVREIFYKNIKSLKSMLKFVYNHNTQCNKVIISASIDDKIRFVIENLKTCEIKIKPFMMGRVINVKEYLKGLTVIIQEKVSVVIKVIDDYINENNNNFRITLKNDKVDVEIVNCEADIELDINTFSQLAFSYIDISEALFTYSKTDNDVNGSTLEILNKVFVKKPNYINEYV